MDKKPEEKSILDRVKEAEKRVNNAAGISNAEELENKEAKNDELSEFRKAQENNNSSSQTKVEENNDVKIEKPGFWGRIGRKIALSLLLPATLYMGSFLGISDTGKIAGRVANEQRGNGWYQIALENDDKIRFHNNNFDLDKVDERIDAGDLVSLIGTKVSGGEYDWKAEGIDATKVDALIYIANNKGFFDKLFPSNSFACDLLSEAKRLFYDSEWNRTTDKNKIKESQKKLEEGIKTYSWDFLHDLWKELSEAYSMLGEYKEAAKALEKYFDVDKTDSDVRAYQWHKLSDLYLEIGDKKNAIEAAKKAADIDSFYQWSLDNLLEEVSKDN